MKKSELKNIIKECVKEVIFEEGILSGIITEVVQGMKCAPLLEQKKRPPTPPAQPSANSRIRQELLGATAANAYEKAKSRFPDPSLFEGTNPLPTDQGQGALSGVAPGNAGVDITNLPGMGQWANVAHGKK